MSQAMSEAMSDAVVVRAAARLRGTCPPGRQVDQHRALMLALLAEGESRIAGAGDGEDVRSTAGIVAALGATVERVGEHAGRVDYRVVSPGGDASPSPRRRWTAATPGPPRAWSPDCSPDGR